MDIDQTIEKTNEINIQSIANIILDIGLKAVLPDFIEEDVIEIKDVFIQEGFLEGLQEILDKLEDIGKSITGIFTGNFDTIEQIKRLIKTDGLLDGVSELIDKITKDLLKKNKISKNTYNLIKSGKKEILKILESELKSTYSIDTSSIEKIEEYCNDWKESYDRKDYKSMKKDLNKIKTKLKKNKLIEETINKARNIEKIQEYIDKKGSIENLSNEEKSLLEKIK